MGTSEATVKMTAVATIGTAASLNCENTDCPLASSAPRAAMKPNMARRLQEDHVSHTQAVSGASQAVEMELRSRQGW
jgi:hypothetical protein